MQQTENGGKTKKRPLLEHFFCLGIISGAATIYRTVGLFDKLGLLNEMGAGRNRVFDLSDIYNLNAHHHHFTCTECGKIGPFDSAVIESELKFVSKRAGFEIRTHQVEVAGVCASCRPQ